MLSSGLFLGVINPKRMHTKIVSGNILASFILAAMVSLALGLVAFIFNNLVMHSYYPAIILIFLIAGIIANLIEIPLAIHLTFYLFKKREDPNNFLITIIMSIADFGTC